MKFSIIVPCFNLEHWISQCLDSVLAQEFSDWECIVIDDESTDGSGAILDEYGKRDCRFKIIHQKNAGEGGARNAGLSVSKGEWIFFLDGDDIMITDSLSRLANSISEDDQVIRFKYLPFDDCGALPQVQRMQHDTMQIIDISRDIKMSEFFAYVWQHIFRRSTIEGVKFKNYKRGCDRVFLDYVLLNRVDVVKVVDYICYGYRRRIGSAMNTFPSRQVLCDEMDHLLDIMEMIDASPKKVVYRGNAWLEKYFTEQFYYVAGASRPDRTQVVLDWRVRLRRLRGVKGLSLYGKFVAWACSILHLSFADALLCYVIPRLKEGGSPIRALKRRFIK